MTAVCPRGNVGKNERVKAVVYHKYGGPDQLRYEDVPQPEPGPGQVKIEVAASSINSWDLDKLRGDPWVNRIGGLRSPRHPILGCDVAGRVEAVGPGVTRFAVGDEVFGDTSGSGFGAFAEYVCAPEKAIAAKPPELSFEEAAAVPQAAVLALQALRLRKRLAAGDSVLFNGAGGGVGTFGIQLAKSVGAEVTAVDAEEKLPRLAELGADRVIDYRIMDWAWDGRAYDLIVDVVAQRPLRQVRRSLRRGGVYAVVGGDSAVAGSALAVGPLSPLFGDKTLRVLFFRPFREADVTVLTKRLAGGNLRPVIDSVFPLERTVEAFEKFAAADFVGKIVISVGE